MPNVEQMSNIEAIAAWRLSIKIVTTVAAAKRLKITNLNFNEFYLYLICAKYLKVHIITEKYVVIPRTLELGGAGGNRRDAVVDFTKEESMSHSKFFFGGGLSAYFGWTLQITFVRILDK